MPITRSHEFRVSVVLYPEDGVWIAQGVEFDVTARGSSPIEASKRFHDKFAAEFIMSRELADAEPLAGVGPAPEEFRTMCENAEMRVSMDEAPRLVDTGPSPHVNPDIRITDRRLAA